MIDAATALLRESGPTALTSVNVAARLGVTQSAIYRHIRDMDELTTLASHAVVRDLTTVMADAVAAPETTWGDGTHLEHFAKRLVPLISEHESAMRTIDRWQHDEGEFGDGIRAMLDAVPRTHRWVNSRATGGSTSSTTPRSTSRPGQHNWLTPAS